MSKEKDKSPQEAVPAEVDEADVVEEPTLEPKGEAVPLSRRAESTEDEYADEEAESGNPLVALLEFLFRGRLTKYLGYSIVLHVIFIVLFSVRGWLFPPKPAGEAKTDGQTQEASAKADQTAKKPAEGESKESGTHDPLTKIEGERRVEKMLGHETAKPGEVPKSPLDAGGDDDLLKE